MDAAFDINEKIDEYLNGKCSKVQQAEFEKQMQDDPVWAHQVNMQKLANEIVFIKGLADLKAKMSADIASGKADSKPKWIWGWLIGFGVVVLVLSWFLFSKKSESVTFKENPVKQEKSQVIPADKELSSTKLADEPSSNEISQKGMLTKQKVEATTEAFKSAKVELEFSTPVSIPNKEEMKIEQKVEVPVVVEKSKVDCKVNKWNFFFHTSPACALSADGSIEVTDKGQYLYALGNGNFTASKSFHHLIKGKYSVSVKDENGCLTTSEVEVYQKNCQDNMEIAFNPQLETWKIPIMENSKGELQIFSKNGRLAFSKQWNQGEEFEWDGKTQNGDLLGRGLYSFTIQYSNGETQHGSISITY